MNDSILLGVITNDGRLKPENELTQYFLCYRTGDLIRAFESLSFDIDFNENEIINQVLYENTDKFRTIIRDALVKAIVQANVDLERSVDTDVQKRRISSVIKIILHS